MPDTPATVEGPITGKFTPRQWAVAAASAVLLLLGGGAGGAFVLPTSGDAAWKTSMEGRVGRIERDLAGIKCVVVYGGAVKGDCECLAPPPIGLISICPPGPRP